MYSHVRTMWSEAEEDTREEKTLWAIGGEYEKLISGTVAHTNVGLRAQMEFFIREMEDYWPLVMAETLARNVLRGLS